MFLDRICTHILAYEGDSNIRFFTGNHFDYTEFMSNEAGIDLSQPKPISFAKLA